MVRFVHGPFCPWSVLSLIPMDPPYSILFYPVTLGGRRGTTDEFATIPFYLDLFSADLVELAKSIPVDSLRLSQRVDRNGLCQLN